MEELGKMEDAIFKERQSRELRFKAMNKAKKRREQLESEQAPAYLSKGQFAPHVRFFFKQ
jgi:5'-3' exoribonuclease 2